MTEAPEPVVLPPSLRLLKALVIVLMLSMIAGVITVTALLVTRLQAPLNGGALPDLPDRITLPEGENPAALTFGKGWTVIVTESDRLLIYDQEGKLAKEIALSP